MQITLLDLIGIGLYFVAVGVFAYFTRRTRSFSEFSVGNRKVPSMMIFASLAATYIGPGFSVGFAGKGYSSGYLFYLLSLTYPLQTILMGVFFAPRLADYRDCHSVGDVMEKKYGKFVHFLTGVISVGLCIGFTAIMGKIAGQLLSQVTGTPLALAIAIVTMFTALYTFTGGIRAVIATDALQFSWFSIVVPILLIVGFFSAHVSINELSEKASGLTSNGLAGMNGFQILGILISFLLGETLIPPYANRALAAKSTADSKSGFILAGLYCLVWLMIVTCLGIVAHYLLPLGTLPDDVFLRLGKNLLPFGSFGLLLAAVIAIIMSSQESVLNSATVSFVRDIVMVNRPISDRTALIVSRVGTLAIAAIAVFVAYYSPSIIDGLLIIYSLWAPGMLVPLLFGLYLQKTSPMAGWLSIIIGSGTSVLWQTFLNEPWGIPAILAGLIASCCGYLIGHQFGFKPNLQKE